MKSIRLCIALLASSILAACGGGGSGVQPMPTPNKLATLSFKSISSAHSAPLQALQMTVNLPKGATLNAVKGGTTGQLDPGTLSYVAGDPYNKVSFFVTDGAIKLGAVFAVVTCDLAAGSTLNANSFDAANKPTFPFLKLSGLDSGGTNVNLVPQINVTMAVELQ